ncbi:MAG: tetratricopeptide repeat protein [Pirellulales bacterium]
MHCRRFLVPSSFTGSIILGSAVGLLMVLAVTCDARGQEYHVGDRVVVIEPCALSVGQDKVCDLELGAALWVESIHGDYLWLNSGKPGWLNKSHVVPLNRQVIDRINALIAKDPQDAQLYKSRASVWTALGKLGLATADSEQAILLKPSAENWCSRGTVYWLRGEHDQAIADFSESLRLDPEYVGAYTSRGLVRVVTGEYEAAIADFTEALRLDPNSANAYANRGAAWLMTGEFDKAIADLDEALRMDPMDASAYNIRGNAWMGKSDFAKAIADLSLSIKLAPNNASAYHNRANVWREKSEYDRAIADYSQILRIKPDDAKTYYRRGEMWQVKSDLDKAIADYTETLRLEPSHSCAFYKRGLAWFGKAQYDKAIADYREALQLNAKNSDLLNDAAWLMATCPDPAIRNGNQAVQYATEACQSTEFPIPNRFGTLAASYAESGDFEKAVEWQRKAVEIAPEGEREDYRQRLKLYESGQPYRL